MKQLLLVCLAILASCQGLQGEKKKSPAAAYDREAISAFYELAASDDLVFATFKSHPIFNLIQENITYEQGISSLKLIAEKFSFFLPILDQLRCNDAVGSPRTYDYENVGLISPTTLHYVALSGNFQDKVGDLSGKRVVQIGAGYGGLCQIVHQLYPVQSYTIVDTAAPLKLTQRYLDANGIKDVRLIALSELEENLVADVVISDASFFEGSRTTQDLLASKILVHAASGFLSGKSLPKHMGVAPYSPKDIRKKLLSAGIEATVEAEALNSFHLFWKKNSSSAENHF